MRFLIDEQLPPMLAAQLRAEGYAAVHVTEAGLGGQPDAMVRAEAVRTGAVLVTKDADFAMFDAGVPAILWVRLGNVRNQVLWAVLGPRLPEITAAFGAGEVLIELV